MVYTVFKSSEGSGRRPSPPDEQLSLATAGKLRRDCIYIELGHHLDRVLGVQATQTDQQTAVWRLWFKGKSLDSHKSQIDTPASLRRLSSWHSSPDKKHWICLLFLYLQTRYALSRLQKAISTQQFSGLKLCIEKLWCSCGCISHCYLSHTILAAVMRISEYQNQNKTYFKTHNHTQEASSPLKMIFLMFITIFHGWWLVKCSWPELSVLCRKWFPMTVLIL